MRWPDGLDIGNGLYGLGSRSVYQRDTLTLAMWMFLLLFLFFVVVAITARQLSF